MARLLYTLLVMLLLPLLIIWMKWRGWRNPAHRGNLRQRLAIGLPRRTDHPLWLHAASVGEVQALAGLVRLLVQSRPHQRLLITVGSPTGVTRARGLFAAQMQAVADGTQQVTVMLAPIDLPGAAHRFLAACRPVAGVFIETELWPNMIAVAARSGVPLSMVSARVSERSTRGYLRFVPILLRHTLLHIQHIGAQSAADAQRFLRLGADPASVQVIGNLKFDFPLPPDIRQQGQVLRARHAPDRPMWVAGSTHPGEEEICVAAQQDLANRATLAGGLAPLLVLAPRKAERFAEVAAWLAGLGVRFVRSSVGATSHPGGDSGSMDVLLLDSLGELLAFYAAADVAFVGGSLVPVGGHNLLEPAALGKPTITGPYNSNSPEAARLLDEAHALLHVTDARTLADSVQQLLSDPVAAAAQGKRAAEAVVANQGAAARALDMILPSCSPEAA